MNRNDCKLLSVLYEEDCLNSFQATTASQLCLLSELGGTKVRQALNEFIKQGYVGEGYKKAQARTFYITQEGVEILNKMISAELSVDK